MNYLKGPQRIVCLTEETTELLYKFGKQDRIVGISSFTVRPNLAKKEKPIMSKLTYVIESRNKNRMIPSNSFFGWWSGPRMDHPQNIQAVQSHRPGSGPVASWNPIF